MRRILLITISCAATVAAAIVPAIIGLAGNPSFSHQLPVRAPNNARAAAVVAADNQTPAHGFRQATPVDDRDRNRAASDDGRARAVGYLLKDCQPGELLSAIRAAAEGHAPLDPRVATALLPTREPPPQELLSAREREVLKLAAEGKANKQIARALRISESTVKVHLGNIYRRIGVSDRTSAAMWAREHLNTARE